jgi:ABC-type branched-subunit amino acid transport system ATPase component
LKLFARLRYGRGSQFARNRLWPLPCRGARTDGAGKTTLLKAISRTVPLLSGHVRFNGNILDQLRAHEVVGLGICHCPEGRRVFPELSVLKNLMLGAYLRSDLEGITADLENAFPPSQRARPSAG